VHTERVEKRGKRNSVTPITMGTIYDGVHNKMGLSAKPQKRNQPKARVLKTIDHQDNYKKPYPKNR